MLRLIATVAMLTLLLVGAGGAWAQECRTLDAVKEQFAAEVPGAQIVALSDADNTALRDSVTQASALKMDATDTFAVVYRAGDRVVMLLWFHDGCFHRWRQMSLDELNGILPGEVAG